MKVKLSCIDICHGSKVVSNDVYIEHFKKQEKYVEHLLKDVMVEIRGICSMMMKQPYL